MADPEERRAEDGLMMVDLARSADAALVIDMRKHIVFWNDAAERLLGFPAREVVGRVCCDIVGLCRAGLGCHAASQALPGEPGAGPGAWMRHEMRTRAGAVCRLQLLPYGAWGRDGEYRMAYIIRTDVPPGHAPRVKGAITPHGEPSAFADTDPESEQPEPGESLLEPEPRISLSDPSASGASRIAAMGENGRSASAQNRSMPDLTRREREVLSLLAVGMTNAEIATALNISPITARNHVISVIEKLNVHTRLQAVVTAARLGLI